MRLLAFACLVACGSHPARAPVGTSNTGKQGSRDPGVDVTLYRDHAVVAHRLEVTVPPAAPVTLRLRIAAGVEPEQVYVVEKSELVLREVRAVGGTSQQPPTDGCDEVSCILDDYDRPCCARFERKSSQWDDDDTKPDSKPVKLTATAGPTEIELVVGAPHEGKYTLVVGYDTERIIWDAGYTMTTTPSHDRAQLRGAVSIRNATGIPLHGARVQVVDALHGTGAQRLALGKHRDPNGTPAAVPRDLGLIDLGEGDTRIELLPDATPRPLRSVLVYDPIGSGLDYPHSAPVQDPNLGVQIPVPTRVTESFELARTPATQHLPGGPVRLLERHADGTIAMLGETHLFGADTLAAAVDTVAVGIADRVTAKRERRELTIDNDRKRIVEEVAITVDNARDRDVEVVLREHLYRGENWAIAYWSVPEITKEGKQQIAMRVAVPAKSTKTVLYVVVYAWGT